MNASRDQDHEAELQRVIDAIERAELNDDPKVLQLLRRFQRRKNSVTLTRLYRLINKRKATRLTNPLARPGPELDQRNGNCLHLGKDLFEDRDLFAGFQETCGTHALILGRSGFGKSTIAMHLLSQAWQLPQVKGILAVECSKPGLRAMTHLCPDMNVARPEDIHLNPCQIEDIPNPRDAMQPLADALADAMDATPPGRRWVTQCLDKSFSDRGVYEGSKNFPTPVELRSSYIVKGRDRKIVDGLLNRLDPCLQSTNMFATRRGWMTSDLSNMFNLLELESQNDTSQRVSIGPTVSREYVRRKYGRAPNLNCDFIVFLDDAQHLCEHDNSFIVKHINVVRSAGIAFILSFQSLKGVHPSILANCGSIFCGHLRDPHDRDMVLRSMGVMTLSEQRAIVRKQSQKGIFLAALGDVSNHSFFIRVPKRDLPFPEQHDPGALRDLPVEKNKREINWTPWLAIDSAEIDEEMRYLGAVKRNEGRQLGITEMDQSSGLGQKAKRVRERLLKKGMLHSQTLNRPGKGKPPTLLTLSPKGKEALKDQGSLHGN